MYKYNHAYFASKIARWIGYILDYNG